MPDHHTSNPVDAAFRPGMESTEVAAPGRTGRTVLILGGYGAVGSAIVRALLLHSDCSILVAGRRLERARAFARPLGPRVKAVELEADGSSVSAGLLPCVDVLVNCVEEASARFAAQCLAAGVHYVDISATASVLHDIRRLWGSAGEVRSSAILSVGVAPGLTNLLTRWAVDRLGPLRHVDISVVLGAGEVHGQAAIRWTLENLGRDFAVQTRAGRKVMRAFSESRIGRFGALYGRRRTYRFDFSDQHTVPQTLAVGSAATWLCFDSRLVTQAFACMARLGPTRLLRVDGLTKALAWAADHFPLGSTRFLVQADAVNHADQRASYAVYGDGEAFSTALVAAYVTARLLTRSIPPGVHHIEEVIGLEEVLGAYPQHLRLVTSCSSVSSASCSSPMG
ncbi:saccharopine dehydrogenase NADP-binding domain-containing protein [Acidovorax sp.]|uniref:saccharopine dehydrogenase family protein n=1 Tax=Acidovorax sp. TaxID=1872122 RepID=UPI0025BC119B|nr:saccharopine dehydrogenase NADP-binding domain-containing protein [Acidovorax sp.]MBW8465611.1 saccharopine dehydrogenase NADP-binding domain-containing protein [Acidovorax sp.]